MTNLQIPDQLANQIQEEAKAEGTTVPNLLAQMLREHQHAKSTPRERSAAITAQLDRVFAKEQSSLDPNLRKLQSRSLDREQW
jgi:hypothetical protein